MATLFDVFDSIREEAEEAFYQHNFELALEKWQEYYKVTAKVEYNLIIKEIKNLLHDIHPEKTHSLFDLHKHYRYLRQKYSDKQIHPYTYSIFVRLLTNLYQNQFKKVLPDDNFLIHGIFCFLSGKHEEALTLLKQQVEAEPENIEPRIFLGHVYLHMERQKETVSILTKNLFLAADQLFEEDLYLSQFKMLYGRLHSETGRKNVAMWLLAFEAWYRNYLIFEEDETFYKIMLKKEQNERIIRVKYTLAERYRHFVRCLYLAEYSRQFIKTNKGMINELENYMEQLDGAHFIRYRKKRKPLKKN